MCKALDLWDINTKTGLKIYAQMEKIVLENLLSFFSFVLVNFFTLALQLLKRFEIYKYF